MVNDSMKWETISNEKFSNKRLNVFIAYQNLGVCEVVSNYYQQVHFSPNLFKTLNSNLNSAVLKIT
jgi:hypothetical protein